MHLFIIWIYYTGVNILETYDQGDLPVLNFMDALNKTNYDGYLSLEIFNDNYRSRPRELIVKDGQRSLKSLIYKVK